MTSLKTFQKYYKSEGRVKCDKQTRIKRKATPTL